MMARAKDLALRNPHQGHNSGTGAVESGVKHLEGRHTSGGNAKTIDVYVLWRDRESMDTTEETGMEGHCKILRPRGRSVVLALVLLTVAIHMMPMSSNAPLTSWLTQVEGSPSSLQSNQQNNTVRETEMPPSSSSLEQLQHTDSVPPETESPLASTTSSLSASKSTQRDDTIRDKIESPASNPSRPLVAVHVGPPKTGTTSLQEFMACHHEALEQDNFNYLGKVNRECMRKIDKDWVRPFCQSAGMPKKVIDTDGSKLRRQIEERLNNGTSVILSDESFGANSEKVGQMVQNIYSTDGHDAILLVGYRRYYSWMVSLHRYSYAPVWYQKKHWETWPPDGPRVPSFLEFFQEYISRQHPAADFRDKFNETIPKVVYVNMHRTDDVVSEFLCDTMPRLNHSCTYYHDTLGTMRSNERAASDPYTLDYELIAYRAHAKGLLNSTISRRSAVEGIKRKFQSVYSVVNDSNLNTSRGEGHAPPLECLTESQEATLLETSLEWERSLVPEFFESDEGEASLRDDFAHKSFCTVDAEQVIQSEAWESLWGCLNEGNCGANEFTTS